MRSEFQPNQSDCCRWRRPSRRRILRRRCGRSGGGAKSAVEQGAWPGCTPRPAATSRRRGRRGPVRGKTRRPNRPAAAPRWVAASLRDAKRCRLFRVWRQMYGGKVNQLQRLGETLPPGGSTVADAGGRKSLAFRYSRLKRSGGHAIPIRFAASAAAASMVGSSQRTGSMQQALGDGQTQQSIARQEMPRRLSHITPNNWENQLVRCPSPRPSPGGRGRLVVGAGLARSAGYRNRRLRSSDWLGNGGFDDTRELRRVISPKAQGRPSLGFRCRGSDFRHRFHLNRIRRELFVRGEHRPAARSRGEAR